MSYSGESGLTLLLLAITSIIIVAIVPFLIGFSIAFYSLYHVCSNKNGRFYIKASDRRIIISLLISMVVGYLSFLLLGHLFGNIADNIFKSLSIIKASSY